MPSSALPPRAAVAVTSGGGTDGGIGGGTEGGAGLRVGLLAACCIAASACAGSSCAPGAAATVGCGTMPRPRPMPTAWKPRDPLGPGTAMPALEELPPAAVAALLPAPHAGFDGPPDAQESLGEGRVMLSSACSGTCAPRFAATLPSKSLPPSNGRTQRTSAKPS